MLTWKERLVTFLWLSVFVFVLVILCLLFAPDTHPPGVWISTTPQG